MLLFAQNISKLDDHRLNYEYKEMNKITINTLVVLLNLTTVMFSQYASAENIFATVNGIEINQSIFDYMSKDSANSGKEITEPVKKMIIKKLIDSELLYQQAQKLGLDKQADFIAREELLHRDSAINSTSDFKVREYIARHELLNKAYFQYFLQKHPASDAEISEAYDKYSKTYGANEYNALHILVNTEVEAKNLIEQLNKGGDFSLLVKANSIDEGSKVMGGGLGWVNPSMMPKPFGDVLIRTEINSVSDVPVQTRWGWHVIKVVGVRADIPLPYNAMKKPLQREVEMRNFEKLKDDLLSKAKIVIN